MADIVTLSATQMAAAIRTGALSAREAVDAHLARIEAVNPRLNALVLPRFAQAREEAEAADAARRRGEALGPLHGVPITIKDQFHVQGLPTTLGLTQLRQTVAAHDGHMVSALRQAGAIVLGKTNVPQTLSVIETDNAIWGRTNNPWDLTRSAGGSSGGEAALIAAGGSPLGLGGDFGGSLRVPAAYCGLCTLRPTARRLPGDRFRIRTAEGAEGIVAQPGPLARRVADVTLAFQVMVDHVVNRADGANPPVPFRDPAAVDLRGLRVAVLPQISDWVPSPAIRRAVRDASDALRARGVTVDVWQDAPDTTEGVLLFFKLIAASGFGALRQLLTGEAPIDLVAPTLRLTNMPNVLIPILSRQLEREHQGRLSRMLRSTYKRSGAELMDLLGDRLAYEARFQAALAAGRYDALLLPTLPLPAVRHGETRALADFWGTVLLFNVLGWPAGVVPITRVRPGEESDRPDSRDPSEQSARRVEAGSAGLPITVQVAAPPWREERVLALMGALEADFSHQPDYPHPPSL